MESLGIYIQQLTYLKIISEQNDQKTQLSYRSKEDLQHKITILRQIKMALILWLLKIVGALRPFSLLLFESFTIVVRRGDYSHNNYL